MSTQQTLPATTQAPQKLIVHDDSAISHLMDTAKFEHLFRISKTMANSPLTPKHLRGANLDETVANCFRVVNQAFRWQMDPFALADESYVVGGKLAYQGKLVAAVVAARAGLKGRPRYEHTGSGDQRTVKVIAQFKDENFEREVELSVRQGKTSNKMWTDDPDQKLCYTGITKWARRHCPEVLMGVLTVEELQDVAAREVDATVIEPKSGTDRVMAMLSDGGPTPEDVAGTVDHEQGGEFK